MTRIMNTGIVKLSNRGYKILDKIKIWLKQFAIVRRIRGLERMIPKRKLRYEVHLAEHCNLNCKGCDNFSPLAKKEFLNIVEYERDVKRLSFLFGGKMKEIVLLGGEPLLHPKIEVFLRITREYFPVGKIRIITNGLLLPKMKETFWKSCRKYSIEIVPTKYPIKFDYDFVEKMARSNGVKYHYFNPGVVKTLKKMCMDVTGKQSICHNFVNCHRANKCITLKHGKLYTCSAAPHASILNDYFNLGMELHENDGIDIYQAKDRKEIMRFLARPIPFCRYCNTDATEEGIIWKQSKRERSEWI